MLDKLKWRKLFGVAPNQHFWVVYRRANAYGKTVVEYSVDDNSNLINHTNKKDMSAIYEIFLDKKAEVHYKKMALINKSTRDFLRTLHPDIRYVSYHKINENIIIYKFYKKPEIDIRNEKGEYDDEIIIENAFQFNVERRIDGMYVPFNVDLTGLIEDKIYAIWRLYFENKLVYANDYERYVKVRQ